MMILTIYILSILTSTTDKPLDNSTITCDTSKSRDIIIQGIKELQKCTYAGILEGGETLMEEIRRFYNNVIEHGKSNNSIYDSSFNSTDTNLLLEPEISTNHVVDIFSLTNLLFYGLGCASVLFAIAVTKYCRKKSQSYADVSKDEEINL